MIFIFYELTIYTGIESESQFQPAGIPLVIFKFL